MNEYKFEVTEKYTPSPLCGTIIASGADSARRELKEYYAEELGTVESEISVKIELT